MTDQCRPHTRVSTPRWLPFLGFLLVLNMVAYGHHTFAQQPSDERGERARRLSQEAEDRGLAELFKGISKIKLSQIP